MRNDNFRLRMREDEEKIVRGRMREFVKATVRSMI